MKKNKLFNNHISAGNCVKYLFVIQQPQKFKKKTSTKIIYNYEQAACYKHINIMIWSEFIQKKISISKN
ncbi:hypothetical protein DERF_008783 [Dermatophagoides farinae]|uniref:Uncharacterized protein n=1 Tax=Dermatophagoides farinae TaxID=6954 RepID=A0A922I340_DERFA|nr:hypothetical protein DERF_008783 [Dermatophagoides farinae]